jgi:TetR/AcrR family transcriptional regulator, regulator of cefoperazone and chloramphenicol sensitivity
MDEPRHVTGPVTRDRLLEAAGEVFAEKGLHGALIRDITRRAGANIASVNYYFRDKFELYALVLWQVHESLFAAINQPLSGDSPEARLRELLARMLRSALDPARPAWHNALMGRELLEPTPALDSVHDLVRVPAQCLRDTVREMRPDLSDEQAMLAACGVIAQCLFYVHHRHIARRLFPSLSEPTLATLVAQVTEFSVAALRGLPANQARVPQERHDGARGTVVRRSTGGRKRKSTRSPG